MKTVAVTIRGISPLLMHAYPMVPVDGIEKKPPTEQAEASLYRTPDGKIFVPGMCLQRCLVGAGTYSKGKGRGSLQKIIAATVFVDPDIIVLTPQKWVLDSRTVRIAATKGTIIRHRPRFDTWELAFRVAYDETLLSETQMRRVLDDAGSKVGLLDFRPACKGPFGRFMVTAWKEGK